MQLSKNKNGFTLIELLIVIALIVILVTIIFATLNPLEKFAQARNTQRWVKISELLNALQIYSTQNNGEAPNQVDWDEAKAYVLGTSATLCDTTCTATSTESVCLDLTDLVNDRRIPSIPMDPRTGTVGNTDFYAYREAGGIFTIGACDPEDSQTINLTR